MQKDNLTNTITKKISKVRKDFTNLIKFTTPDASYKDLLTYLKPTKQSFESGAKVGDFSLGDLKIDQTEVNRLAV